MSRGAQILFCGEGGVLMIMITRSENVYELMNASGKAGIWDESTSADGASVAHNEGVFQSLFERSADAIWLYDPHSRYLIDCNQAALTLMGAKSKEGLVPARPEDISPAMQPD